MIYAISVLFPLRCRPVALNTTSKARSCEKAPFKNLAIRLLHPLLHPLLQRFQYTRFLEILWSFDIQHTYIMSIDVVLRTYPVKWTTVYKFPVARDHNASFSRLWIAKMCRVYAVFHVRIVVALITPYSNSAILSVDFLVAHISH